MDKQALINEFQNGQISKHNLGKLRRICLEELLAKMTLDPQSLADKLLNKKRTKIDLTKLCSMVGYGVKPVNIRQSFKGEIDEASKQLELGGYLNQSKTSSENRSENVKKFLSFIGERLDDENYEWPINTKGKLYRKGIWAFFLDIPLGDVQHSGGILSTDLEIKTKLAEIDVLLAKGDVKTIDFSSDYALDEFSNTMTNAQISQLRHKLKETQEKLVVEREARKELELKLKQFEEIKKRLLSQDNTAVKAGSIH